MSFDINKSIIIDAEGQSNMRGNGSWAGVSSTGLYSTYSALKSTAIDSKLLCRNLKILGATWDSDRVGDFYEHTSGFQAHSIPDANNINMCYSFLIELMLHLNSVGFTKNVIYMNFGIGGTALTVTPSTFDWGTTLELSTEANNQLTEVIKYEQEVNGNDSQIINVWHQGEADQADSVNHKARMTAYYERKKKVFGFDFYMFIGQLVPSLLDREEMNAVFFDFASENSLVHVVGQGLAGGVSTWDKMEADDPDGVILESTPTSYTFAGDNTHYNWSAQILQGRQLWDLVKKEFFGL